MQAEEVVVSIASQANHVEAPDPHGLRVRSVGDVPIVSIIDQPVLDHRIPSLTIVIVRTVAPAYFVVFVVVIEIVASRQLIVVDTPISRIAQIKGECGLKYGLSTYQRPPRTLLLLTEEAGDIMSYRFIRFFCFFLLTSISTAARSESLKWLSACVVDES